VNSEVTRKHINHHSSGFCTHTCPVFPRTVDLHPFVCLHHRGSCNRLGRVQRISISSATIVNVFTVAAGISVSNTPSVRNLAIFFLRIELI